MGECELVCPAQGPGTAPVTKTFSILVTVTPTPAVNLHHGEVPVSAGFTPSLHSPVVGAASAEEL